MQRRKSNFKNLKKFKIQFFKSLRLRVEFYSYFEFFSNLNSYFFIASNFLNCYKLNLLAKPKLVNNETVAEFQNFNKLFKSELDDPKNCIASVHKMWFRIFFPHLQPFFSTQRNVILIADKNESRMLKDWDRDLQQASYFSLFSNNFRYFEFGSYAHNLIPAVFHNLTLCANFMSLCFFLKILYLLANFTLIFNTQLIKICVMPNFFSISPFNLKK